ncbi:hypothetical protein TUM18999_42220 [Pseudomonas tohonis]|uniref:Uncharacterized protein n=1 Tax=Pseudomonas tohonis TaxID=2725477 RepID=A0A6J4EC34_9PSED|nr:hypothetical protein TUM18999_42220 [Pseudomonas tohonis]GJN51238.1 hypothetical protein TUM20286_09900 [Pseudomonas tohonis]
MQLGEVLAMDEVLDEILVLAFLTVGQVFDQLVPMQQIDHLSEAVLQAFLRLSYFYFGHSALHPQWRRTPRRVNQSIRDRANAVLSNYWVSP